MNIQSINGMNFKTLETETVLFINTSLPFLKRCKTISFEYHCSNRNTICDLMSANGFDCADYKAINCNGGTYTIKNTLL